MNTGKSHNPLFLPYSSQHLKSQITWWDSVVQSLNPASSLLTDNLLPLLGHSHRDQGVARPLPPAVTWTQVIISPFQAAALPHPAVPRHQPESCCRIQLAVPSRMVTIHLMGYHQEHMYTLCFFSLVSRSLWPSQQGSPGDHNSSDAMNTPSHLLGVATTGQHWSHMEIPHTALPPHLLHALYPAQGHVP